MNCPSRLNNASVSFLVNGDDHSALASLRSALSPLLKHTIARLRAEEEEQPLLSSDDYDSHDLLFYVQDCEPCFSLFSDTNPSSMIHSKAFYLGSQQDDQELVNYSEQRQLQVFAIMFYNMGFSLHFQATHRGMATSFQKAIKMYNLALRLLEKTTDLNGILKTFHPVYLALLNNIADCFLQLTEYDQATGYFEQLGVLLGLVRDSGYEHHEELAANVRDYLSILDLNVLCGRFRKFGAAPAA